MVVDWGLTIVQQFFIHTRRVFKWVSACDSVDPCLSSRFCHNRITYRIPHSILMRISSFIRQDVYAALALGLSISDYCRVYQCHLCIFWLLTLKPACKSLALTLRNPETLEKCLFLVSSKICEQNEKMSYDKLRVYYTLSVWIPIKLQSKSFFSPTIFKENQKFI